MNARALEKLALENMLRRAIENGEFRLYYQPLVTVETRKIFGAEALLRWMHPDRGLVMPGDFIAIAELSGLILPIGNWVLEKACADLKQLQARLGETFTVSVNLSARQFQQPQLADLIRKVVEVSEIGFGTLHVEITESNAMEDAAMTARTLEELRRDVVGGGRRRYRLAEGAGQEHDIGDV